MTLFLERGKQKSYTFLEIEAVKKYVCKSRAFKPKT